MSVRVAAAVALFGGLGVGFAAGCRHGFRLGQRIASFRSLLIHREAVSDVVSALQATQTHGGDCDRMFRIMRAVILDQRVELLAFRNYAAALEGEQVVAEAERIKDAGGGS